MKLGGFARRTRGLSLFSFGCCYHCFHLVVVVIVVVVVVFVVVVLTSTHRKKESSPWAQDQTSKSPEWKNTSRRRTKTSEKKKLLSRVSSLAQGTGLRGRSKLRSSMFPWHVFHTYRSI